MRLTGSIRLFVIFSGAALLLAGCGAPGNQGYTVLEAGYNGVIDDMPQPKHVLEYAFWSGKNEERKEEPPPDLTVTFHHQSYQGKFDHSGIGLRQIYRTLTYMGDNVIFEVQDDTKELTLFNPPPLDPEQEAAKPEIGESACRALADEIMKEKINLSEYTCRVSLDTEGTQDQYVFEYMREIAGMDSADHASVCISTKGTFLHFYASMLNRLASVSLQYDQEKGIAEIEKRLDHIYEPFEYYRYTVGSRQVVLLDDGRVGVSYMLTIELPPVPDENGNMAHFGDMLELIVLP